MSIGARRINETRATLSNVAEEMSNSIDKIGNQIVLFKV